jgi:hypothetical protein
MARYEIEGMKALEKTIKQLGELPQKVVTKAARQGTNIALKTARKYAPIKTGNLRKGLVLKGEKLKVRGKKVYQVTLRGGPEWNAIFQKKTEDGKVFKTKKDRNRGMKSEGVYYYPASQEYGFIKKNGGYVQGKRYLKKSLEDNKRVIEGKMVEVMTKEIDKLK